jgi:hypothetical protein
LCLVPIEFDKETPNSVYLFVDPKNIIEKVGGYDYTPVFLKRNFEKILKYSVTIKIQEIRTK